MTRAWFLFLSSHPRRWIPSLLYITGSIPQVSQMKFEPEHTNRGRKIFTGSSLAIITFSDRRYCGGDNIKALSARYLGTMTGAGNKGAVRIQRKLKTQAKDIKKIQANNIAEDQAQTRSLFYEGNTLNVLYGDKSLWYNSLNSVQFHAYTIAAWARNATGNFISDQFPPYLCIVALLCVPTRWRNFSYQFSFSCFKKNWLTVPLFFGLYLVSPLKILAYFLNLTWVLFSNFST